MRKLVIIGDSTCDLNKEMRTRLDIDYLQMGYVIDGKEYPASLDWEGLSASEFYNQMRAGKHVTTTQVPAESILKKFQAYLNQDADILYVACSSALSGSVNTAAVVSKELLEEYPEARIRCVDSRNSSLGQGIQIMWANELRGEGKDVDEIADFLEKNRNCVNQCGTAASLEYLKRAGRVKASAAFFGNLVGIKPIVISDAVGQNFAVKKAKGMKNAMDEIAAYVQDVIIEPEGQTIYITHADAAEDAQKLGERIQEVTGCKAIALELIGPIVGASVGPGTIISYCVGKEETRVGEA